jgi:UDP-3-O-[3-hydroxymyristoyl] glucosamine N-acyltransferase
MYFFEKGMDDISTKSSEYQSLETLLIQKSPPVRFQQVRERESKELFDAQTIHPTQQLQPSLPEKATNISEKTRIGSSVKTIS